MCVGARESVEPGTLALGAATSGERSRQHLSPARLGPCAARVVQEHNPRGARAWGEVAERCDSSAKAGEGAPDTVPKERLNTVHRPHTPHAFRTCSPASAAPAGTGTSDGKCR